MTEYKPRYRAGDIVASTNSGKLYCIRSAYPLDAIGSFGSSIRGMRNGRGYGPLRSIAESGLCAPPEGGIAAMERMLGGLLNPKREG
jgi:hypothetical protein